MAETVIPRLKFDENIEIQTFGAGAIAQRDLENTMRSQNTNTSKNTVNTNASQAFMRQLDVLQKQQANLTKKVGILKKRNVKYNKEINKSQQEVLELQAQSNNGARIIEDERSCHKAIHRLEHQIQQLKIKLSVKRTENKQLVFHVNEARKDKALNLEILKGIDDETSRNKNSINNCNNEIMIYNEKKHKAKVELSKAKNGMITDMENFQDELKSAKAVMSDNQQALKEGAEEKMQMALMAAAMQSRGRSRATTANEGPLHDEVDGAVLLEEILGATGVDSLEALMEKLSKQETEDFRLFKDIQEQSEEVEELETKYKSIHAELLRETAHVEAIETKNAGRRADLEHHIKGIESKVAKNEHEFASNLDIVNGLSDGLTSIMKLIALQSQALDCQLIDSGINERNIPEFLCLLEDRIDFIMQMKKAVNNEILRSEDFVTLPEHVGGGVKVQPPSIPSMSDDGDDDDDEDSTKVVPVSIKSVKLFMDAKLFPKKARLTRHLTQTGPHTGMTPRPPGSTATAAANAPVNVSASGGGVRVPEKV